GDADRGHAYVDAALARSPLDPLLYAMLAVRGFAYIIDGDMAAGAEWAERGARAPGAHVLIDMIACAFHGVNGDDARATFRAAQAEARAPELNVESFFRAFPFRDAHTRKAITDVLTRYGF